MEPARVHITTYGCQMNQLDSELAAQVLRSSGAELVADPRAADVLLFVTCAVRAHAENRVFSNIGKLAARKRREPHLVVGLLGCMAQEHGPAVRRRAPLVDLVCAPGRLADLADLIAQARGRLGDADALDPPRGKAPTPLTPHPQGERGTTAAAFAASDAALDEAEVRRPLCGSSPGQAYVVAIRGCDNFCSYCVVPYVRGPERSRAPSAVLEEVRRLVGQGARQITLLGQAVNQYAAQEGGRRWDLADLLAKAAETPGLARLAFITNHPAAFDERLAGVFRDVPNVCPYLHMPAQSGSDAVLERMNRGYTHGQYLDRVEMARAVRPDLAVASDFIVGFPGETEAEFEATCDLVRRARFSGAFVFKYSPRPGTPAARQFPDDVPDAEKRRRNNALLALVEEMTGEENRAFLGRTVRVFVGEISPRGRQVEDSTRRSRLQTRRASAAAKRGFEFSNPQSAIRNPQLLQLRGRTPCNRIVVFDGPPSLVGTEVDVRVTGSTPLTLFATRVDPAGP
ncbi:MAG: MiaB/RimO family radical SAM methylthiotransferase [Planctomycetota bacterium]|nr:MiaB/RimO family radical SAM methylthiotransferase [Planctomycetota bacterium]